MERSNSIKELIVFMTGCQLDINSILAPVNILQTVIKDICCFGTVTISQSHMMNPNLGLPSSLVTNRR